jgi:hypothetical protein
MPDATHALGFAAALGSSVFIGFACARIRSMWWGLAAAVIFASTPLLWHQYGSAPATLYPLLFVTAWLAGVAHFEITGNRVALLASGGLLGAGMYTSASAAVMMPVYVLLTVAAVPGLRRRPFTALACFGGTFAVISAPFALQLILHPDRYRLIVNTAHLYDANRFNVLQGIREMTSWLGLTARSEVFYDYFNPAFLFFPPAVLLWPLAVLIPLGLYHIADSERMTMARLALAGFFVAPLAASLTALAPTPGRIVFITPFAAMVATFGLQRLLSMGRQFTVGGGSRRTASR